MARTVTLVALLAASVHAVAAVAVVEVPPADIDLNACLTYDIETGEPQIDPTCFFDILIERYRRLSAYEDTAQVTQVMRRAGEEPKELQTRIGCEIDQGRLQVQTPASQIRRGIGLDLEYRKTEAMKDAALRYDIWLAPHMALRFAEEPKREFRAGIDAGFTATEAEAVTIDARPMVHLELKSGDGRDGDCEAKFDLYVNPESMLIERIEGRQRLPDGGDYETTLQITPLSVQSRQADDRPDDPAGASPPDTLPPGAAGRPGAPG